LRLISTLLLCIFQSTMRALRRPRPEYNYNAQNELNALINYRDRVPADPDSDRRIPAIGQQDHVLIATWNIANLGVHDRRPSDLEVIAGILSWFEIIALQEVADNLNDLEGVVALLPEYFSVIFNDRAGNDERSAFIYDTRRVSLGPKVGEVVIVESDRRYIRLQGINRRFIGFNRNPYIVSFEVQGTRLVLANCHLLYGSQSNAEERQASMEKRQLEAYAIARWCDLRRNDSHRWTDNIIALGDFNLPDCEPGDPIYDALRSRGLRFPAHTTRLPHTNVSNSSDYDQMLVVPGLYRRITEMGVFDFDGIIFNNIYDRRTPGYWRTCTKYYISDHRPLWMQLRL